MLGPNSTWNESPKEARFSIDSSTRNDVVAEQSNKLA